ncbi:DNA binding, excisionase family domain protein, partial [Chlamydia psittaci C1/97]
KSHVYRYRRRNSPSSC